MPMTVVHSYRSDRSGGGVGLYLTTELDYKLRNDFAFPDQLNIESLFIEIISVEGKNPVLLALFIGLLVKILLIL
jgi:hypothetical protein